MRYSAAALRQRGVTEIWEIGAGRALSGMIRRIVREIEALSIATPDEVKAAAGRNR